MLLPCEYTKTGVWIVNVELGVTDILAMLLLPSRPRRTEAVAGKKQESIPRKKTRWSHAGLKINCFFMSILIVEIFQQYLWESCLKPTC